MLDSNCFGRKSTFYGFSRSVLRVRTVNEIPAPQESQNHPARRSRNSNDPIQKASSSWLGLGREEALLWLLHFTALRDSSGHSTLHSASALMQSCSCRVT